MEQQIQDLVASIRKEGIEEAKGRALRFWKKPGLKPMRSSGRPKSRVTPS